MFDPATGEGTEMPSDTPQTCDWAAAPATAALTDTASVTAPPRALTAIQPVIPDFAYTPAYDPRGLFARGPPTLT